MTMEPFKLSGAETPRLFVDIDDTLIFWKRSDASGKSGLYDSWEVNFEVYEAVKRFKAKYPDGVLVFWSTGGGDYARKWVKEATPELIYDRCVFLAKYPAIPYTDDVFLDDMPTNFPWAKLAVHPRNAKDLFR